MIYVFKLSPQFGFFYGQSEEIVYRPNKEFKSEMHSQLLWDMKPIYFYGLLMNISRAMPLEKWGFFSSLSLLNGIPGKSGSMEDRDWLSKQNKAMTNYSKHDNFLRNLFFLDYNAGFSIPFKNKFLLKPSLNLLYIHFNFYGVGGYRQYANEISDGIYDPIEDASIAYFTKGIKVINYTQNWLIGSPGLSSVFYFFPAFSVELSFQLSPLILCSALDEHLVLPIKKQFRDYTQGGIFIRPALFFSFSFKEIFTIALDISWLYITNSSGVTYSNDYGKSIYFQNGNSGAALSLLNTGILFKFNL